MKKLIGIVGIAVIAMAMFFNTNALNSSNGDFDLASLLNMNSANAECTHGDPECFFKCDSTPNETCKFTYQHAGVTVTLTCDGKKIDC